METVSALTVLVIFSIVVPLYFLQDTITELLSNGKSFMPPEMKGFNSAQKSIIGNEIRKNKLSILIIDVSILAVSIFTIYLLITN